MSGVLGGCLSAAARRFTAAEASGPPARDHVELAIQAWRLVTVLGRYLDGAAAIGLATRQEPDGGSQMAAIRAELRAAAAYLERVLPPADHPMRVSETAGDPVAARYANAVDALAAGADLLRTHVSLDALERPLPRSDWAQVLAAEPVAAALAGEITGWARRAERLVDRITSARQVHRLNMPDLDAARDRLAIVARADIRTGPPDLAATEHRELLHAVPSATVEERVVPAGDESDAALCAGIAASARRLRAFAFAMTREPAGSTALSGQAWRRTSYAAAIICDLAAHTLRSLADEPSTEAALDHAGLRNGTAFFTRARDAWRHTARMWHAITTDSTSRVSPTTADTADLVLRLGRLAFGDPGWTPATAQTPRLRQTGSLAPDARALAAVIGAVHEAGDAVACMASADLTALDTARVAGRLYMSVKVLENLYARHTFVPAPADRVHMLKNAYYLCADTTWNAAAVLDGPVLEVNAPSKPLALIRAVAPAARNLPERETGFILDPDLFAGQVPLFSRPRGAHGRRRRDTDPDAVVHAYEDEGLTLEECGERFSVSPSAVKRILEGQGRRTRTVSEAWKMKRDRRRPEVAPLVARPGPSEKAPLYQQLRRLGVGDPGLLDRAAIIDRAAADVLHTASQHLDASPSGSASGNRQRSPAELAAKDVPRGSGAAITPEAVPNCPGAELKLPRKQAPQTERARGRRA